MYLIRTELISPLSPDGGDEVEEHFGTSARSRKSFTAAAPIPEREERGKGCMNPPQLLKLGNAIVTDLALCYGDFTTSCNTVTCMHCQRLHSHCCKSLGLYNHFWALITLATCRTLFFDVLFVGRWSCCRFQTGTLSWRESVFPATAANATASLSSAVCGRALRSEFRWATVLIWGRWLLSSSKRTSSRV